MRKISLKKVALKYPEGSCLIRMGDTIVLATASIEEKVPPFLIGTGKGWVTAEYNMLPRSNKNRKIRSNNLIKPDGRALEIQRLIGRALRTAVDRKMLGERTITIDCEVIQADGGTRTASINAGFVALYEACQHLVNTKTIKIFPIRFFVGAVSVGKVGKKYIQDLCYAEDSKAIVDMNIVLNEFGDFIELQGSGEEDVYSKDDLNELIALAQKGIEEIILKQKELVNENTIGNI
ncbi:MAG: ribonuclease PH [Firmicutes bacterium]|nr:ribonuclease PH [Bacillota bacterium]